jgi:DNA polymerase III subunit epsilon
MASARRQIFLDTETTGLSASQGDRILEIGCIEMENRRLTGRTLHHYINPQRASHPDALRVHGITEAFLADKPTFAQVAQEIVDFVAGAEIIIHNADFDVGFLNAELQRVNLGPFASHAAAITDSLLLARETFPGKGNSLDALCKRLEVDNSNRELHGALLDAGLLAEVYLRLTRGQKNLVIDAGDASDANGTAQGARGLAAIDFGAFALPLVDLSEEETAAHAQVLADIDKASGKRTVWRQYEATA